MKEEGRQKRNTDRSKNQHELRVFRKTEEGMKANGPTELEYLLRQKKESDPSYVCPDYDSLSDGDSEGEDIEEEEARSGNDEEYRRGHIILINIFIKDLNGNIFKTKSGYFDSVLSLKKKYASKTNIPTDQMRFVTSISDQNLEMIDTKKILAYMNEETEQINVNFTLKLRGGGNAIDVDDVSDKLLNLNLEKKIELIKNIRALLNVCEQLNNFE